MLQSGKAKPMDAWAKMASSQTKGTSPSVVAHRGRTASQCSEDSDPEDRVPVPVFQNSFGDAIQEALNRHMWKQGKWTDPVGNQFKGWTRDTSMLPGISVELNCPVMMGKVWKDQVQKERCLTFPDTGLVLNFK